MNPILNWPFGRYRSLLFSTSFFGIGPQMANIILGDLTPTVSENVKRNIGSIAQLEHEFLRQRSKVLCLRDRIHDIVASSWFISAHIFWLTNWIWINTASVLEIVHFDPYPYCFLALCLASEATMLTTFVLMSQKRQSRQNDQWAHVSLQVGLLAEQETTKMLCMLQAISQHLGMKAVANDVELKEMTQKTPIMAILQELEKAREADETATPSKILRAA